MKYIFVFISFFPTSLSLAQSSVISAFRDNHDASLSLYFYPSTLRMINIERNPEFDDMITEIKKARFFRMDSAMVSKRDIAGLEKDLAAEGFEEIMFFKNSERDILVWGLEKRKPIIVMLSKSVGETMILEIEGMVNIAKIPKLAQTFNQDSFIDILNLNQAKR